MTAASVEHLQDAAAHIDTAIQKSLPGSLARPCASFVAEVALVYELTESRRDYASRDSCSGVIQLQ